MVANCTIYYLDTSPVVLTRSTTIRSLSEYFFGARVADADSNHPPRRKIVTSHSVWRIGLHKFGRELIWLAEMSILHHKDPLRYFKIHQSIQQFTLVKDVPA